jgi:hypothetical protein
MEQHETQEPISLPDIPRRRLPRPARLLFLIFAAVFVAPTVLFALGVLVMRLAARQP